MKNHRNKQRYLHVAALAGLTVAAGAAQAGQAATVTSGEAQTHFVGGPVKAAAPGFVNFKDLPAPNPADLIVSLPRAANLAGRLAKAHAAAQHQAEVLPVTATQPPQRPSNLQPQTPGVSVAFGGDSENKSCSGAVTANEAIAIGDGSNPILQVTQNCVSVWSSAGVRLQGPKTIASFFGVVAGSPVIYPRALYDWYNHQFIAAAIDGANHYYLAVSASDDPTGGWYTSTFETGVATSTNDFTRLGQDRAATYPITSGTAYPGAIYLASDIFNSSTGAFDYEEWLILPKAALYNGQGFSYWGLANISSNGLLTNSSQPVNVWSPYDNPRAEFFVASKDINTNHFCTTAACNGLTVYAVSNPFGFVSGGPSPEVSSYNIATANSYTLPPNSIQAGSSSLVYTDYTRITGEATYSSGSIFAALPTANGTGGVASIFYRLRPTLNANDNTNCTGSWANYCPQINGLSMQDETLMNYGTTTAAFFPVQQPDLEGNVVTAFSYCTASTTPGVAYRGKRATQGPGFPDNGVYLVGGAGPYTANSWGAYNGVAPAGVGYATGNGGRVASPGVLFSGMYSTATNSWATEFGYTLYRSVTDY